MWILQSITESVHETSNAKVRFCQTVFFSFFSPAPYLYDKLHHRFYNLIFSQRVTTITPCMWNGMNRPCYLFARKFLPETLDNMIDLFSSYTTVRWYMNSDSLVGSKNQPHLVRTTSLLSNLGPFSSWRGQYCNNEELGQVWVDSEEERSSRICFMLNSCVFLGNLIWKLWMTSLNFCRLKQLMNIIPSRNSIFMVVFILLWKLYMF